jgi:hypothetical protein
MTGLVSRISGWEISSKKQKAKRRKQEAVSRKQSGNGLKKEYSMDTPHWPVNH